MTARALVNNAIADCSGDSLLEHSFFRYFVPTVLLLVHNQQSIVRVITASLIRCAVYSLVEFSVTNKLTGDSETRHAQLDVDPRRPGENKKQSTGRPR